MKILKSIFIVSVLIVSGCSDDDPIESPNPNVEEVTYRVTFDAIWSATTHPTDFPFGPHFSGIIGMTHSDQGKFFEIGGISTEGMRVMAELGGQEPLATEIGSLISGGVAENLIRGGGIGVSPGMVSVEFDISEDYPLVTIVSMIAPSPDWFIGVEEVNLYENNEWVDVLEVPVLAYDAGTDSGISFASPNAPEDAFIPIHIIIDGPLAVGGSVPTMGTMTFERLN